MAIAIQIKILAPLAMWFVLHRTKHMYQPYTLKFEMYLLKKGT